MWQLCWFGLTVVVADEKWREGTVWEFYCRSGIRGSSGDDCFNLWVSEKWLCLKTATNRSEL